MTTHEEIKKEMARRKSQTARLLDAFKQHGELTTKDLMRIGTGVSSRLHTLRKEGWKIVAIRDHDQFFRYKFLGHKDDAEVPVSWKQHRMRNKEDVSL